MTDLREPDALSTGELLADRYELRERIGEGGMARVYRAYDRHLQRTVAVKVFRGTADGIGSVERAMSETTLLASVSHHALVTVFDAHVSPDEVSYFVMEHVDGITLAELIARGPVNVDTVAAIATDLAEGLHSAHSAGIVHRDIKPSNVLLEPSPLPGRTWRAKLADFGIAYLRDSTRVTTPGLLVGTAAYVAPEQARGADPAPPADIYSLGIVLIEALTGRRPFADAEGIGTVVARLAAPPEVPDTLPLAWQGLLRGMTAMRPGDRPTALEVAVALARTVAPVPSDIASIVDITTSPLALPPQLTAVLPLPDADADAETDAVAEPDAVAPPPPRREARRAEPRRRRRTIMAGIVTGLVLLAMLIGSLWVSNLPTGTSLPTPSPTTVQQEQQQPTPVPTVAPPPATPAVVENGDDERDARDERGGQGNGNGNGNGNGPGSNSGNGGGSGGGNNGKGGG